MPVQRNDPEILKSSQIIYFSLDLKYLKNHYLIDYMDGAKLILCDPSSSTIKIGDSVVIYCEERLNLMEITNDGEQPSGKVQVIGKVLGVENQIVPLLRY